MPSNLTQPTIEKEYLKKDSQKTLNVAISRRASKSMEGAVQFHWHCRLKSTPAYGQRNI